MAGRAEVGERRVRKNGVYEKTGPGKWTKVRDEAVVKDVKRTAAAGADKDLFANIYSSVAAGERPKQYRSGDYDASLDRKLAAAKKPVAKGGTKAAAKPKAQPAEKPKAMTLGDIFADTSALEARRARMAGIKVAPSSRFAEEPAHKGRGMLDEYFAKKKTDEKKSRFRDWAGGAPKKDC